MTSTNFSNKIDSGVVEVVWGHGGMADASDFNVIPFHTNEIGYDIS